MKRNLTTIACGCLALGAVLSARVASATPYASGLTNAGGTISFILNEPGGNVTITYEDGTTNANYDGISTGTNLGAGVHSFALGSHTSYAINVFKAGSGSPSLITSHAYGTPRGVDVNKNPASPYFGRVYQVNSSGTSGATRGLYIHNSDLSYAFSSSAQSGGVAWVASSSSPYRIAIADDDFIMAGDATSAGAAVWRIDPNGATNQLFLGPVGEANALSLNVFGTPQSRPLLVGTVAGGNAKLFFVDGDLQFNGAPYNSLYGWNIGSGPLPWETSPDVVGPQVGINLSAETLGQNEYPGLTRGPNGYLYTSTYRNNLSNPLLQVIDPTGATSLWNSYIPAGATASTATGDYFLTTVGGFTQGTVDSAVSPDGRYVVGVSIDNWFIVAPLTNGIPDVANLFTVTPTSFSGNARGIAFDAADNIYLSSSGIGALQEWSLGLTTLAVTHGNGSGSTGFQLTLPSTTVSVAATTPNASQSGPTPAVFTLTRTNANNDYSFPVTVNFSLSGTATNGVYTCSPTSVAAAAATNSITFSAGETVRTVTINPVVDTVPRPTTTVVLALKGGSTYSVTAPFSATALIQNIAPQAVGVSVGAGSMYKAFTNDYASFIVTRIGDTNAPSYTVSTFTYTGTAVAGVDFVTAGPVTFNPGDLSVTNRISPSGIKGPYVGNKSIVVGVSAGTGYAATAATAALTLIDNANPLAAVLWTNSLSDPTDAIHWNITYGDRDNANIGADYDVQFGYDITANNGNSSANGIIPPPPGGATNVLRITANKSGVFTCGGVNLYPTNVSFSGDYAVRFNMNLIQASDLGHATEGGLFGINHDGKQTNWWSGETIASGGPWPSDGVWYWIDADAGGASLGDYVEFAGPTNPTNNTGWQQLGSKTYGAFSSVFKDPAPYSTVLGVGTTQGIPANGSPLTGNDAGTWSDVELKQVHNVVTLSINKTPIFVYTNVTTFTNGTLMLGYDDPFSSVGTPDAAMYVANLSVVRLGPPVITAVAQSGANITLNFTSIDGTDTPASFALQSAATVTGPYADVASATITQSSNGVYQAVTAKSGAVQFYRLRHK